MSAQAMAPPWEWTERDWERLLVSWATSWEHETVQQ
jgi:hypothetical protein